MKSAPFKGWLTYRLARPELLNAVTLAAALPLLLAGKPAEGQLSRTGFVPCFPGGDELVGLLTPTSFAVSIETQERLLPSRVLKDKVAKRIKEFEDKNDRSAYAREKSLIKVEVIEGMIPRAFLGKTRLNAIIDLPYIYVETSSVKKAEGLLACLRRVLGSFPVQPLAVVNEPIMAFSSWVDTTASPEELSLGEAFVAKGKWEESHTLAGKNVSLDDERLSDYLSEDYRVTSIELSFPDSALGVNVPFVLNETLGIKGVKWPEALIDLAEEQAGDDDNAVTLARASTLLMSDRIHHLVQAVCASLGGERVMESLSEEAEASQRVSVAFDDYETKGYDLLLPEVRELVVDKQRCTISMIQREYRIGYNRAARIVEQLEAQGVVGPIGADLLRPVWKKEAWKLGDTNLNTDFGLVDDGEDDGLI